MDASTALSPTKKIQKFDIAPELHRLGLLRGSRSTLVVAQVLHLIANRGRSARWIIAVAGRAGLVGALEQPWFRSRVLLEQRRRSRHSETRAGERPVGVGGIGAVVRALGLGRSYHLLAQCNAFALGGVELGPCDASRSLIGRVVLPAIMDISVHSS